MDMDEKEVQINTKIILFDEKVDEIRKKLDKLAEKIRTNNSLLDAVDGMQKENREKGGQWGEALLFIEQMLTDQKDSLTKQKESLHAQMAGFAEFAEKLRNNQQLEFEF